MRELTEYSEMNQRGDSMPRSEQSSLLASLAGVFAVLSEVFLEPEADVKNPPG